MDSSPSRSYLNQPLMIKYVVEQLTLNRIAEQITCEA